MIPHPRRWGLACCLLVLAVPPAPAAAPPSVGRTDEHGFPLPPGAVARLGRLRFRQMSDVSALAFSPDGKILATGGRHLPPVLWDVATGRRLPSPVEAASALALAFSPDGKFLAWGGSEPVHLWDIASRKVIRAFPRHQAFVKAIAFSPDGKFIAAGGSFEDFTIRIWEADTGRERHALRGHGSSIFSLAFSPDGKLLASGSCDESVRIWDAVAGRERHRLKGHKGWCSVAFSPDGKLLASGGQADHAIRLTSPLTGAEVGRLRGIARGVQALAFSPKGGVLAALDGQKVQLWAPATGKKVRELADCANSADSVLVWSRDGSMLAWPERNYSVSFWKVAHPFRFSQGHAASVFRLVFSPDGAALASVGGVGDGRVLLWDTQTWKERQLSEPAPYLARTAFASGGKVLVTIGKSSGAFGESEVRWWDTATGRPLRKAELSEQVAEPFAFSADGGRFASNREDAKGGIVLCRTDTGRIIRTLSSRRTRAGALSPDGKTLATGGFHVYRDGMLLSPTRNVPVFLYDINSNKLLHRLEGHQATIGFLAFSPDGRSLVSAAEDVRLWSASAGRERYRLNVRAQALAFAPDGRAFAIADLAGNIRLYETVTGQERQRLLPEQGGVLSLAFSPDGATLASGGEDTTILIWRLRESRGKPDLVRTWASLADEDARTAYRALQALAASEQLVPFLRGRLSPAPAIDRKRIDGLIADLDGERFATREQATRALEEMGETAAPALRRALAKRPSLDLHRRAERLLERAEKAILTPAQLREVRAVEALERAGSLDAIRLLEALGKGAPEARLTQEARASLRRLARLLALRAGKN